MIKGKLSEGEVPGLKSVEIDKGTPESIISLPLFGSLEKINLSIGKIIPTIFFFPSI